MKTIISDKIPCKYSRKGTVGLEIRKCDITGKEDLCVFMDSSEEEYGEIAVSLEYLNLQATKLKNITAE